MFKKKKEEKKVEKTFKEEFAEEVKANKRELAFDLLYVGGCFILKAGISALKTMTAPEE